MTPLAPPDAVHLLAAEGWLELGNTDEANEELEKISPGLRAHPDVQSVRWHIYASAKQWQAALDIAVAVTKLAPDEPTGWVQRSCSLHKLARTEEARELLLDVQDRFPLNAAIRYNLACYECQLGRVFLAKQCLERAFALGDANELRLAALDDPDLEPLWRQIGSM